ncbi:MAG: proprotein convertase P-domain-containing protein, partial [Planctomycetes bacterium]|nr:proprotein convertase P-domain-containing protein [Planctomycetota bacterium]
GILNDWCISARDDDVIDQCSAPGTLIADGVVTTDTLTVAGAVEISDLDVAVDFSIGFLGDLIVSVSSPAGTTVELLAFDGDVSTALDVIFDDSGEAQPPAGGYACGCPVMANGLLGAADGEIASGTWTLTINDTFVGSPTGILNEWCVQISGVVPVVCVVAAPESVTCAVAGSDILATWTEPDAYDSVDVLLDGGIAATLAAGVGSFTIAGAADGRHIVEIAGNSVAGACAATSEPCRAAVGFLETCVEDFALNDDVIVAGTDVISYDIAEVVVIADVDVVLQFTSLTGFHEFIVTSPFGTAVQLHIFGGGDPAFDLIWTDAGAANTGALGNYDCGGCTVMPSGPGSFADFFGELSVGTWTIDNGLSFNTAGASIDLFCLGIYEGCTVLPPTGKTCTVEGDDILLEWTNGEAYDAIDVERDGVVIATLAGSATSYLDAAPPAGEYTYRVFGSTLADACSSGSLQCTTLIGIVEACSAPGLVLAAGAEESDVIAVGDAFRLADLEVRVEIAEVFLPDLDYVELLSPEGTLVRLYDGAFGSDISALDAMFSDAGVPQDGLADYNCGGTCLIAPSGPGAMSDFVPELVTGDFTLSVLDFGAFGSATLDEWCLRMYVGCPVAPPTILSCTDNGFAVELEWAPGDKNYDSQEVYEDDILVAALGGSATAHTLSTSPGAHTYRIRGLKDADECGNFSDPCAVLFALNETCSSPALAINVGSPSISDSLVVVDSFTIADVRVYLDIPHGFIGDLQIDVSSAQGTSVVLFAGAGGASANILATFDDAGAAQPLVSYDCSCDVAPVDPLSAIAGESSDGTWTINIEDTFPATGDGSLDKWCVGLFDVNPPIPPQQFKRGNARGIDPFNALLDGVFLLNWQFSKGPKPPCWNAADADGNNVINALIDTLVILNYQFSMGPEPPDPGPVACGPDPDGLDVLVGGSLEGACAEPPAYCNP